MPTHIFPHAFDWPALVNVVDSKSTDAEHKQHGDKHVVDGSDVIDLKQLTVQEGRTKRIP